MTAHAMSALGKGQKNWFGLSAMKWRNVRVLYHNVPTPNPTRHFVDLMDFIATQNASIQGFAGRKGNFGRLRIGCMSPPPLEMSLRHCIQAEPNPPLPLALVGFSILQIEIVLYKFSFGC